MKVYYTCSIGDALDTIRNGFKDVTGNYGFTREYTGVYVANRPLDINEGCEGDTVLTLEVPDALFEQHEFKEEGCPYRYAIVPAESLNACEKPRVYDHEFAGITRRDLVKAAEQWEAGGQADQAHATKMRQALAFFDEVGWQAIEINREPK